MADAIAITLHQLPHSLGERAAKAFDIQRLVDVLCYAFQTSSKLFWGLLPRLGHTIQCLPSTDPGNGSLMQHHLLQAPWLMSCVVLVIRFQGMLLQSSFEVRSDLAGVGRPKARAAIHEERLGRVCVLEAQVQCTLHSAHQDGRDMPPRSERHGSPAPNLPRRFRE